MNTQTADRTDTGDIEIAENKGAVAIFAPPRLPFHDAIKQRFGIDRGAWKVLTEAIFPAAKTPDAIVMALSYCKARSLDIMKRPVHIVPMWSSAAGNMVETVWPGISELRTTAFRTGNYAGCDEAEFGPITEYTFKGRVKEWVKGKDEWNDKVVKVDVPEWCRITMYRALMGQRCKFVGPKVKWLEAYATIGFKSDLPNDMWQTRSEGQLEKCAEAAALRRAFPEEIGNELTAEEMQGRVIDHDARVVSTATTGTDDGPPDPDAKDTKHSNGNGNGGQPEDPKKNEPDGNQQPGQSPPPVKDNPAEERRVASGEFSPLSQLLDEMAELSNNNEAFEWTSDNMARIKSLSGTERKTFDLQFLKRQGEFSKAAKKAD
jgi:phage recombination protein Bet